MNETQMIRPSQFILVYGPGAILEGPRGPRIILDAHAGLFRRTNTDPNDFSIDDQRMSRGVLGGKKIYRLPSNAELGRDPGSTIYATNPFPRWRMCMNVGRHDGHYLLYRVRRNGWACPVCRDIRNVPGATRFVTACPMGHMDEVPWFVLVHGDAQCSGTRSVGAALSQDDTFYCKSSGSISTMILKCPRCGLQSSLKDAYFRKFRCNGRFPEREAVNSDESGRDTCGAKSSIIQRQASNLHVPVVETHFTIRPLVTKIHEYMENPVIMALCEMQPRVASKEDVLKRLQMSYNRKQIPESVMGEIRRSSWDLLNDAIESALEPPSEGFMGMIREEFRELVRAAKEGAPPMSGEGRVLFEVERNSTENASGPGGERLRVTPIKRMRTVTVQTGYRRMVGLKESAVDTAKEVDVSFNMGEYKWCPGVEFLGEGIFVTSPDLAVRDTEAGAAREWSRVDKSRYLDAFVSQHNSFRELNPEFVWWHTLSHALIRTIGEHAGYSSTSIRERVYLGEDGRGGILLYATQPGNDGTLGGLVSMIGMFDSILDAAMEHVVSCSGDPLCSRQEFKGTGLNGAACYGCVMNSETSCEHRNMWLDRHVLLDGMRRS